MPGWSPAGRLLILPLTPASLIHIQCQGLLLQNQSQRCLMWERLITTRRPRVSAMWLFRQFWGHSLFMEWSAVQPPRQSLGFMYSWYCQPPSAMQILYIYVYIVRLLRLGINITWCISLFNGFKMLHSMSLMSMRKASRQLKSTIWAAISPALCWPSSLLFCTPVPPFSFLFIWRCLIYAIACRNCFY